MGWRLRTGFGEMVVVVRATEASRQDAALRVPSVFVRSRVRNWLFGFDGFDRRAVLEMYEELRGHSSSFRTTSDLQRDVLPVVEDAFASGALLAFKVSLPLVSVSPRPEQPVGPGSDVGPTEHWVEFRFLDPTGQPIADIPYKIDLPGGNRATGKLTSNGSARYDSLPAGVATIILADVEQARWGVDEIDAHEPVDLSVRTSGFDPGESVTFEIFRLYRERDDDLLATLDGTLDAGGGAEATWTPESIDDPDGQFVFKATVGNAWRKSAPLKVRRDAVSAEWSTHLAHEGDQVTLRASVRGIADGESATIAIFEKRWRDPDDEQADSLDATVTDGAVEATWSPPAAAAPLARGETGRRDFYFTVGAGDLQYTSDLIAVFPEETEETDDE